jgi:hypothetical protein
MTMENIVQFFKPKSSAPMTMENIVQFFKPKSSAPMTMEKRLSWWWGQMCCA